MANRTAERPVDTPETAFKPYVPASQSLKAKRAAIKPIIDGARHRFPISVAEVEHHEQWQRAGIGVAAVSSSISHLEEILDAVDRFVWSHPDVEVLSAERSWLE